MKRIAMSLVCLAMISAAVLCPGTCSALCSFGLNRDSECLNRFYEPQCHFPPLMNSCAVPCREPGLQPQAVPMVFDTACPSMKVPCNGVSYGNNPYPLFRVR